MPDIVKVEPERIAGSALEAQTRGEIDMQIATAKRYPRSISVCRENALALATMDEEVAASCFYNLPRGGRVIEGPSARLAEIMATSWGHMRNEARVIEETDKFIVARGVSWDLQSNVAVAVEVRRRITDKSGKRYNDDMITMTSNAACSIALRNAVFKTIPNAFTQPIFQRCKDVVMGSADTVKARVVKMLDWYKRLGVTEEMICALLGKKSVDDIDGEGMVTLRGLATALKEGDTSVEQAFTVKNKQPERATASIDIGDVMPGKVETHKDPGEKKQPVKRGRKPNKPKATATPPAEAEGPESAQSEEDQSADESSAPAPDSDDASWVKEFVEKQASNTAGLSKQDLEDRLDKVFLEIGKQSWAKALKKAGINSKDELEKADEALLRKLLVCCVDVAK